MRVGDCLNTLKGGGTEKNIFKKGPGGKLGQGVGALKWGAGTPLTNYYGLLTMATPWQ